MVNIDNEKCIGCGLCVSDCVADNIVIENGKATLINSCLQCGHCVAVCPMNAVTIPDYDMNDVEEFAEWLRPDNPRLGTEVVRGGQFVEIPVRHPLSVMVADGYAAIGDSAFMTVPLIGSGIANSLPKTLITVSLPVFLPITMLQ